jgi:NADPH:quinone reductase-like Zn-dependent oxidoreductase
MIGLFTKGFGLGFPAPWDGEAFQSFDFASRTLVILGAGASIAKLLVRIASKVLGIKNVIAIASLSNRDDLTQAGASHVVDRHDPDDKIIQQVLSAAGGHGNISQIIDCASWEHHLATALLTPDKPSRLVTYHAVDQAKVREQRPQCEATAVRCSNANMGSNAEAFWKELPRWLEAGLIQPTAFKTLDGLENVDEINKQLDEYAAGKGYPQLVVHP